MDCATNLHTTGCHLLCHDDVIGTRKVSFIIYLTSPDEEWTARDGGALEIYPSVSEGTPDIVPLKTVLPLFNTMVSDATCGTSKGECCVGNARREVRIWM